MNYQSIYHKFFIVKEVIKKEGVISFFQYFFNSIYLKRFFNLYTYNLINGDIDICDRGSIKVEKNNFELLLQSRNVSECSSINFYYDVIDNCRDFYILSFIDGGCRYLASICWVYDNSLYNKILCLSNNVVELKHLYTVDRYRGCGYSSILIRYILSDLKLQGYDSVVAIVESNNAASNIVFKKKCNFSLIKTVILYKILFFTISKKYNF